MEYTPPFTEFPYFFYTKDLRGHKEISEPTSINQQSRLTQRLRRQAHRLTVPISNQCKPQFLFHSPQILTNQQNVCNGIRPIAFYIYVLKEPIVH